VNTTIRTELILPTDVSILRLAQNYVRDLADLGGLSPEEMDRLALAVEEACTNSIEHGSESGESGTFTLVGELTPTTLTLAICDRGLPFDQSLAPVYKPPESADAAEESLEGLGLQLIRRAVDEVRWINHGRKGKELRLTKYLATGGQTSIAAEEKPGLNRSHEPEPGPSSHRYIIRRMLPEDALRVSQCFFRTFGYSYEEDLYIPERLISLNRSGEFISVVAVEEESGEVVGHLALVRPNLGLIGERTHLVVSPDHRSQQLRKRMGDFLEGELQQLGIVGMFGQAVTTHTISQEASESRGFHVCGISLGMGMEYNFKKLKTSRKKQEASEEAGSVPAQRESLVIYFKYLETPPPTAVVHAPPRHREMLERIYAGLQAPVEFREPRTATGQGLVNVSYFQEDGLGEIQVQRVGADTIAEVRRARRDLCDLAGAEVINLDLPLAQEGTPDLCAAAEEDGFFFSGVWPRFAPDGDFLRLQYLNISLDPSNIRVFSPLGRELLAYALREKDLHRP